MENFSTNADVFFELYKNASERTRCKCIPQFTKRQIRELKLAGLFKYKREIKLAKYRNPGTFPISEFNEEDFYNVSLDPDNMSYIKRVKHITKKQINHWFEVHKRIDRWYNGFVPNASYIRSITYEIACFFLNTKLLSDEQVNMILTSNTYSSSVQGKSLAKIANEIGYQVPIEVKTLYYANNAHYAWTDFVDPMVQDQILGYTIKSLKSLRKDNGFFSVMYHFKDMSDCPSCLQNKWKALRDVIVETNNFSYENLFEADMMNAKLVELTTDHLKAGDFNLEFLDSLGLNIISKSQRLLLDV